MSKESAAGRGRHTAWRAVEKRNLTKLLSVYYLYIRCEPVRLFALSDTEMQYREMDYEVLRHSAANMVMVA
jgi:hypothetical protein